MTVAPVPRGAIVVDTDTVITGAAAAALKRAGVAGVVRYLSRAMPQHPGDLSVHEAAAILGAGLGLFAVQHVAPPRRWQPAAALGAAQGVAAVANARAAGLPPGVSLALDIESPAPAATAEDVFAYENAWTAAVRDGGYRSLVYLAQSLPELASDDLFYRIRADRYWRSASQVPEIQRRGWCMEQSRPRRLAGLWVDQNLVVGDAFGGVPQWTIGEGA